MLIITFRADRTRRPDQRMARREPLVRVSEERGCAFEPEG